MSVAAFSIAEAAVAELAGALRGTKTPPVRLIRPKRDESATPEAR